MPGLPLKTTLGNCLDALLPRGRDVMFVEIDEQWHEVRKIWTSTPFDPDASVFHIACHSGRGIDITRETPVLILLERAEDLNRLADASADGG